MARPLELEATRDPRGERAARAERDPLFHRKTAGWLVGIGAASLAVTLILLAFGGEDPASVDPSSFSRSAIGHHALAELVRRADVGVLVSRHRSGERAGPHAPLLIAEPTHVEREEPTGDGPRADPEHYTGEAQGLAAMIDAATGRGAAVVVVLPKWRGTAGGDEPGWVEHVALQTMGEAAKVLAAAVGRGCSDDGLVIRPAAPVERWNRTLPGVEVPSIVDVQLVGPGCAGLEPMLWAAGGGALVLRDPSRRLYIVSDPDLLNTHGLAQGDNAVVAHRLLVDHLAPSTLVIDEVLHGFGKVPSIWTELFSLPLLPVTLHVGALLMLALWTATARFGKPEPVPPRVLPGKRALVDSTAGLLTAGGHHTESLRHYLRMALRQATQLFGLRQGLDEAEQVAQLAALARDRNVTVDIAAVYRELTGDAPLSLRGPASIRSAVGGERGRPAPRDESRRPATLTLAASIARWLEEIKHGHR